VPVLLAAPDLEIRWQPVAQRAGQVLLVVFLAWLAVRIARRAIPRAVARLSDAGGDPGRSEARTRTLTGQVQSVVTVVIYSLALFTALGQVGIALGPLLAGAGVVGLAVGFGAQQLVRDVISGFFVLVEDQYAVGDSVTAGGVTGVVEGLTLRLTKIRSDDGVLHHVRNGDLGVVSNASRGYAVARVQVPLPVDADTAAMTAQVERAMAELVEAGTLDDDLLGDPVVLGVTEVRAENGVPLLTVTARSTTDGRSKVQRTLLRAASAAVRTPPAKRPARKAAPTTRR
jgi:small conductance mechanosensitive channel